MKDTLFLLRANFMDGQEGPFFCPETAMIEGMLSFYPRLRVEIEIHYIDFAKPRQPVIGLLGEAVQRTPVLVLGDESRPAPAGVAVAEANGRRYIAKELEICAYLAHAYRVGRPHP